ncbi:MAG: tyrosine-type recombinase/integrase [Candidatus Methanomethylicaceae archaeon]
MGLYRRGQTWWMSFTYRGKQYRKSTETSDRKLARRIYDKVRGELAEGKWFERLPGEEKTFREMMEKYLTEYASKRVSFKSFQGYVKKPVAYLGDYTLTEITPRIVNEFKVRRLSEGVKPATVNRELAVMKKAFNLALKEWEWVRENPVVRVSMEKEDNKRDRWLTYEEEEKVLSACPSWLRELVVFSLNTGFRLSEVLNLTWEGVDLFRRTITVFKTKNKENRTIPMSATVFEMLKEKAKVRSVRTSLVFYNESHSPYLKTSVDHAFKKVLNRVGIKNFRFHDLRHTFATRLIQAGVDFYKVQKLLGHKSPQMTMRYAHHYPETLRDAIEILDKKYHNFITIEGKAVGDDFASA